MASKEHIDIVFQAISELTDRRPDLDANTDCRAELCKVVYQYIKRGR